MLDSLRKAASTWAAKLLLGILVLSFAVWGISGSLLTSTNGEVITAGDTTVTAVDYRLAYDRRIAELSQQLGTRLTREQAVAFGIDEQVLSQLTAGAVLDETARKMGLGVSRDKLAELTAADPAFRGLDGRFDRNQFEFVLSRVGMRPEDYLKNREQAAARQQIVDAVATGVSAPDELLRNVARYRGEDRTVEYVPLPRSAVEPIEPPSEEELKTWFEEHKADYAAPEYRKVEYVKLEAEDIADPSVISDEQVEEYYNAHRAQYTTPERRTIEQLNFASTEEANTARESMRTGTTFEDLVGRQGKKIEDVSLGSLTRADIPDPAISDAAFSLAKDQVSDVVQGSFGPVLLRVTEITPEAVTPLDEVREQIRQQLALDEANRLLLDTYDQYEDARAGGDTMQEAAEKLRLTMRTIAAVDRQGNKPDGTPVENAPNLPTLVGEAFDSEVGVENPPINLTGSGFLFYEVAEIIPARDRDFAEVRDRVLADWTDAEAASRLDARAKELEEQLKNSKTLDQLAAEIGQEKVVKRGLKREASDADLGQAGVEAVFSVAKGGTGIFSNPAGDARFIFQVTEVFEPAAATAESLPNDVRNAINQGLENDLLNQLVTRLQAEQSVTVNRTAMQQALAF
ncbi:peptidyl-prolyl cis-trans isomerase [Chelativorans sp. AA-79]|uniref:peptidyl-prolyl cis-trans isomerase n=1 Tax=Chelativorans sp. AA-79 TaxID=3028735 RepID=UPI0023F9C8A6|nr:peptidyl-prolyl cis-trans isomerase [Chelativorans sp. AA-79]WEX07149.1 SurA N-terminal domain-containing protein [Chelativorans sp. AA-79]